MNTLPLKKTAKHLLEIFKSVPQAAIITGSGIKLFGNYKLLYSIKYSTLPFFKRSNHNNVKGHEGLLKLYKVKNKNILVFSGRKHLYQDLDITDITANVKLAYEIGISKIIITNAAGGISKNLKTGDLMLIDSFIDLMQPTERGVLSGINLPPEKISSPLTKLILHKFRKGIKLGTYAGVCGPSYETLAEIKLLQLLGADAVGMSTIPEIIFAKSLKMDYAAVSIISNTWNKAHTPSHKDVLSAVEKANNKLNDLILKLI